MITEDVDAAVTAARSAGPEWAALSGTDRARVLFTVARMLDDRRDRFVTEPTAGGSSVVPPADESVTTAVDRWYWYAGWADKVAQLAGSAGTAGPGVWLSLPRPVGTIAVVEPRGAGLSGLVEVLAPVLAGGNTAVVLTPSDGSGAAVTLAEVLAISELPTGVVTVLAGPAEVWPQLASHDDVDADARPEAADTAYPGRTSPDGPRRILAFQHMTTLWQARGR
jgi:acyl-CoA reductase-like NAD-dependent aldehyde dehydrogenase